MQVSELGEFNLIDRLTALLPQSVRGELIIGIGDDAAVWKVGERYLIATTDTLIEGVHFPAGLNRWKEIGWKALAVSISDLAAMGAADLLFGLITLGVPSQMELDDSDELYRGIAECAGEYKIAIVGGDVVKSDTFLVTVAALARAHDRDGRPLLLRRDRARPGDLLAVTGPLGDSAGGRRMIQSEQSDHHLVSIHLRPQPPVAAAGIAALMGVACGIDVSDGLLRDIGHICARSGLGATVQAANVPMSDQLRRAFPKEALELACTGGEDYQIVLAAAPELMDQLKAMVPAPLVVIGEMTEGEPRARLVDPAGAEVSFESAGWDHLRP